MADQHTSLTAQNESSTRLFSDQLVLRDVVVRAVINEHTVSVAISAALSVHIGAPVQSSGHATLDHA